MQPYWQEKRPNVYFQMSMLPLIRETRSNWPGFGGDYVSPGLGIAGEFNKSLLRLCTERSDTDGGQGRVPR